MNKMEIALIESAGEMLDTLRSIELSVDAVNGGGCPKKALRDIKGKCREAIKLAERNIK